VCERNLWEILVEQQPPQAVFVCDHAGLVINKFPQVEFVARVSARRGMGKSLIFLSATPSPKPHAPE